MEDNKIVICEFCGARCKLKDGFCQSCWKKLPSQAETETEDFIIDGIGQSEWEAFIERNTDHYIPVYKKHEGKKVFLHMNWAASFFGLNWVLYRRMYKFAVLSFIGVTFFTVLLYTMFLMPHMKEIKELIPVVVTHRQYLEMGGPTILYDEQGVAYTPDSVREGFDASRRYNDILTSASYKILIIIPLTFFYYGLLGDAVYKQHIKKNMHFKEGGTSVGALVGGRILLSIIEAVLITPAISVFSALLIAFIG